MKKRIILHIDCNNAFLSWTAVHKLHSGFKIDIRDRYSVIGGDEYARRGIVLAKSNLCKQRGVVTGETLYSARKKCPYLDVYPPEFSIYKKYSDIMYTYLCNFTDKIERFSIDECFLDYTDIQDKYGEVLKFAYNIKNTIRDNFGFTVNVGIGDNKLLAKMASDFTKPDKVHTLYTYQIKELMWPLNVGDLFMIGKSSSKKLINLGITTIGELANTDVNYLTLHFKSLGRMMWEYANGIDNSIVDNDRGNPKSISNSTVLPYDYSNREELLKVVWELTKETGIKLRKEKMYAGGVFVWLKFNNFKKISKQITLDNLIDKDDDIYDYSVKLIDKLWDNDSDNKIRALCVGVGNLTLSYKVQLSLFHNDDDNMKKDDDIEKMINTINKKYGNQVLTFADKASKD